MSRRSSRTHRANLHAWAAFRRACGNELVVDVALMQSLGLAGCLPDVIPRPIPISRKLSRLKPVWPAIFLVAAVLWAGLLFPCLLCLQMLRTMRQLRRRARRQEAIADDVAVVLTARLADVVRCVPEARRPRFWLTTPWMTPSLTPADGQCVSLLSFARISDLLQAAYLAWRAVHIVRRKGLGHWAGGQSRTAILQTYIAWEWFLTWQVLPRCVTPSAGLWYANHYDRWTVLLDRLPAGGRRHLVQHGFARGNLAMPYRQRRVTEVLYFDQATRRILQDVALSSRCRPQWTPIQAQLKLTPVAAVEGSQSLGFVLVIGQPVEPDLERELLAALAAAFPTVRLLYKAHPLYGRSGAAHVPSPPVEIVWERSQFPAADVVLSGGSWLGVEYESTGIPVVWYKSLPKADLIEQVASQLDQARRRRPRTAA